MQNLQKLLFELCSADFIGAVTAAAEVASAYLVPLCDEVKADSTGGIIAKINGKSDRTVMLQAHLDQIGAVVTNICGNGFVTADAVGGLDIRTLPSQRVLIHTANGVTEGVFTSVPPHLAKEKDKKFARADELFIDCSGASASVAVGDYVTFNVEPAGLQNGFVTAKSLDNRCGCAALIRVAQLINEGGEKPEYNIVLCLSSGEELGNRGAAPNAFEVAPDEAIALDVSFGMSPGAPAQHCGKCGDGAMIGVSPVLSGELSSRLHEIAKQYDIKHQTEVMSSTTSTDADVIAISRSGVKTALVSVPLRYMHTPVETVALGDVESTAQLLYRYVSEVVAL